MADLMKKLSRFLPVTFATVVPEFDVEIGQFSAFPNGFHGTNPSIVAYDDGYLVCIRGVNYELQSSKVTDSVFTVGDQFMSVNRFMLLDRNFSLRRKLPALDNAFDGVEDIKLFSYSGKLMGFGSCPTPNQTGMYDRSACVIVIDDRLEGGTKQPLPSPFGYNQEKNWAPFVYEGELHFIYSFDPLIILAYDVNTQRAPLAEWARSDTAQNQLKFLVGGSSAGLPIGQGYLFAAHRRRVSFPRLDHNYLTCLYYLEPATSTLHRGPYFSIGPASVQFVNGLIVGDDHAFYVSYGIEDASAHICRIPPNLAPPIIQNML